jgi:urate oxidase
MQVPVFKVIKGKDGKHEVLDMVVQIMLNGDVSLSWTKGDNSQIVPTETQKNTCYAIALQLNFNRSVDRAVYMAVASHRHPSPLSSHHCHPPTAAATSTHHQPTTTTAATAAATTATTVFNHFPLI